MPKRKFIYKHYYCDREMSKNAFLDKLQHHCTKLYVHGNGDNPLMNIEYVDLKLLEKKYNQIKRSGYVYVYQGEWFQIKKVEVKQ